MHALYVAAVAAAAVFAAGPAAHASVSGPEAHAAPSGHALVRAAVRLAAVGRHLEAEETLRKALAAAPDLVEAHENLGAVLHRLGRYDEAAAAYRAALARDPARRGARMGEGLAHLSAGRAETAAAAFAAVLAEEPNDAEALVHLGWARLRGDSLAAAGEAFRLAADLDPAASGGWLGLALVLDRRGAVDAAAAAAARAVEAAPSDYVALYHLGRIERAAGRPAAARAALERAAAAAPGRPEAPTLLARLLADDGAWSEAESAAGAAEAAAPLDAAPPALRGHAAAAVDRRADATAAFRIALDRDPADEALRFRLEEAYALSDRPDTPARASLGRWRLARAAEARARGDLRAERRHLLRAVRAAPLLDSPRAALARNAEARGLPREALSEWGRVLEITRDPILRREATDRRVALGRRAIHEWTAATGRGAADLLSASPIDAAGAVEAGALEARLVEGGGAASAASPALAVAVRLPASAYHPGADVAIAAEVAELLVPRFDAAVLELPAGALDAEALMRARGAARYLLLVDLEAEGRVRVAGRIRLVDPAAPAVLFDGRFTEEGPFAHAAAVLSIVRRAETLSPDARVVDLGAEGVLLAAGRAQGLAAGAEVVFVRPLPAGVPGEAREAAVGRGRLEAVAETLALARLVEGAPLPGDAARSVPPAPAAPARP